jgi:hypothetical protein
VGVPNGSPLVGSPLSFPSPLVVVLHGSRPLVKGRRRVVVVLVEASLKVCGPVELQNVNKIQFKRIILTYLIRCTCFWGRGQLKDSGKNEWE